MSQQQHNGRDMDRQPPIPGSVRRARERAEAALPREALPSRHLQQNSADHARGYFGAVASRPPPAAASGPSRIPRPPPRQQPKASTPTSTSRPMNAPQWPLPGPSTPVDLANPGFTQPSSAAPSQPEPNDFTRPVRAPPANDLSRLQHPVPPFISRSSLPESPLESLESHEIMSPVETLSTRTSSPVGTIPDFPLPATTNPAALPRRSAAQGRPLSSRRGLSNMYSSTSLVSPIPEESPRPRSHESYASSAAMPETWGTLSLPLASPGDSAAFFDDSNSDRSRDSTLEDLENEDETKSVRNLGGGVQEGKAELDSTASTKEILNPFGDGTGYVDASTGDLTAYPLTRPISPANRSNVNQPGTLTSDAILRAYAAASMSDPAAVQADTASASRTSYRHSNLRRPPQLDMGAVRAAEERGSLTSLPDLIKRATRLASLIDKGKRPGSRLEDLSGWASHGNTGSRDGDSSLSGALA